ncbi:MAG: thioredoxin domain-containing protein [Deltaproteobacteria bacterium]|nr:thioredoxin domain-containing protein [Deltaproteobacteria bacterium]
MLEKNPKKVKLAIKNFPLRNHKFAVKAAMAALVAQGHGKFWEFHDRLFKNYDSLSHEKIKEIARELGLDEATFEKGLKNPGLMARIRRDMQDGRNAGVEGTPTIFVNGKRLRKRSMEGFQTLIDKELGKP